MLYHTLTCLKFNSTFLLSDTVMLVAHPYIVLALQRAARRDRDESNRIQILLSCQFSSCAAAISSIAWSEANTGADKETNERHFAASDI